MSGSLDKSLFRFYHGRSMRFTFRPGDCIYFKRVSVPDLAVGDVIVFSSTDAGGVDIIHCMVSPTLPPVLTAPTLSSFILTPSNLLYEIGCTVVICYILDQYYETLCNQCLSRLML